MNPAQRTAILYPLIGAVVGIVATVAFFALRGPGEEQRRLAAAQLTLGTERDALKVEVQTLRERVRALEAERDRLAASAAAKRGDVSRELAETGQTLEEAKARAAELNKSYEALLKEMAQLTEIDAARRAELERIKQKLETAQAEVARLTGARGVYTVQAGDSLSKIAAFFYHNGYRWPDIFRANSFLITDPDLIYPRMVLIVPQ